LSGQATARSAFQSIETFIKVLTQEGGAKDVLSCSNVEEVEMTINRTGYKVVVHLINVSGARRQNFGSHIPVSGGDQDTGTKKRQVACTAK
jgi:hypothetical protein